MQTANGKRQMETSLVFIKMHVEMDAKIDNSFKFTA